MGLLLLIIGIVLFVCLVLVHEWGHYKAARRGGVDVEEFGLGFPPKLWSKRQKSGMLLSVNLLPLGGFVRLRGEHDADTDPGTFGAAPLSTKVKIMLAGVFMNLITAMGVLLLLAWLGMPQLVENQFRVEGDSRVTRQEILVGYIEPNSPAEQAGVQRSDVLVSIALVGAESTEKMPIIDEESVPKLTKSFAGQEVVLEIKHRGQIQAKTVMLRETDEVEATQNDDIPKGYLGVVPVEYTMRQATWSAPIVAVGTTAQFAWLTLEGLGTLIFSLFQGDTTTAANQVSGPVGIVVLIKDGAMLGYQFILLIVAVISLTLAIMNSLPIPALDGGRLFVLLLFRALRKPLKPKTEDFIHGTGFVMLLGLLFLITIVDIRRFF